MKSLALRVMLAVTPILTGLIASPAQGNFDINDNQTIIVNTYHEWGELHDSSHAQIVSGGYVQTLYTYDLSTMLMSDGGLYDLWANGHSTITISGGSCFFICPYGNDTVNIFGDSVVHYLDVDGSSIANIYGGSVYDLRTYDSSTVNILGGSVGSPWICGSSTVNISGGSVGSPWIYGSSTVNISGGSVGSPWIYGSSTVNISGGSVGSVWAEDFSTVNISDGSVDSISAWDSSTVNLSGQDFFLPCRGGLSLDGNRLSGFGTLSGKWMDGTPFSIDVFVSNNGTVLILGNVINTPPTTFFNHSPDNPIVGENITFDASASSACEGTIVSYEWDFGDGDTAQGEMVTHSYTQLGEYLIRLTVTDDGGLTASTSESVTVHDMRIGIVDPYFGMINNVTDPEQLADGGRCVIGLTADGVTPLLIKAQVTGSGTLELSLKDEIGTSTDVGTLSTPRGNEGATTLEVPVNELSDGRYMAFCILTAPPVFYRGVQDEGLQERIITIEAKFTPSGSSNELTETYPVRLIRPPVVMVHGLWGQPTDFTDLCSALDQNGWKDEFLCRVSYNNVKSFRDPTNIQTLSNNITNTLSKVRAEGYAVRKVDVVAHSMGGLLAKNLPAGFAQGTVRKIITIGTPYQGSPVPNKLWNIPLLLRYELETRVFNVIANHRDSISGGAVFDLQENPLLIKTQMDGVDCSNVIAGVSDGSPDWQLPFYLIGLRLLTFTPPWVTDETLHKKIFDNDASDWVVPEHSQYGDATFWYRNDVSWHTVEPKDSNFVTFVREALNQPAQIDQTLGSLIDNENSTVTSREPYSSEEKMYFNENAPSESNEPNGTIEITSPSDGQICTAGEHITISVQGTGDTALAGVIATFGTSAWADIVQLPWTGDVNVPSDSVGSAAKIFAIGLDANMNMTSDNEVNLVLESNIVLDEIFFGFGYTWYFDFKSNPEQSHQLQLYPMGRFSDGSEHPLSVLSDEIFYWSYDEAVASIDSNSLITVHSRGTTWIEVYCAGSMTYLEIEVDADVGDLDLSGFVDYSDLVIIADQWLQPPGIPSADIAPQPYGDGIVNFLDFALMAENWMK